jgi:hypothetical protein
MGQFGIFEMASSLTDDIPISMAELLGIRPEADISSLMTLTQVWKKVRQASELQSKHKLLAVPM